MSQGPDPEMPTEEPGVLFSLCPLAYVPGFLSCKDQGASFTAVWKWLHPGFLSRLENLLGHLHLPVLVVSLGSLLRADTLPGS